MAERGLLILGAGGFIGRALAAHEAARGERVVAALRREAALPGVVVRAAGHLSARTDWAPLLRGVGAVVHLASRAHAPPAADESWIEEEAATAASLAAAALRAGVARIVLLSSVKVHGERTKAPFRASDPPAPADAYGRAKLGIERAIASSGVPHVILRPPLVYGPGVTANFRTLMRLVARGVPLPLGSVRNERSFIFLGNLIDLIDCALRDERALGQAFLMRDDRSVSTPELIRLIAAGLGRRALLFPCPPRALTALARLAGRGADAGRLIDSLAVDDAAARTRLDWRPRVALADGIAATCRAFLAAGG